tara:strand:- start:112 stop:1026 length:915 start_codon:yes stop_codon:yes gene_type:complete
MGLKIVSIKSSFPYKSENLNSEKYKKIIQATGINKRYLSSEKENVINLSVKSAKKVLNSKLKNKISFLLFVSQTSPYKFPSVSCILQNELKLPKDIYAVDINMGCSGYIYALKLASSLEKINNKRKYGLIICSDTYTKYIKKDNKSCEPIFSDASTTTLLKISKKNQFQAFDFGVDGSGYQSLLLKENSNNMFMDGAKVAIFTIKEIPQFINKFLLKYKLGSRNIKYIALHQASKYVCDKIKEKLNFENNYFLENYNKYGNTVSSTIPLLIKDCIDKKKLKKNNIIIACGFGVGLSWGIVKIKW